MLYRYFIGSGEVDIESVEQVFGLYRKGMINGTSKLYDVANNVYVTAAEIPRFNDVFQGNYIKEDKSAKMLRLIFSCVFFLLFLLISMLKTFVGLGIEQMENNTTYALGYLLGTFIGVSVLIVLATLICFKASKKYNSILTLSISILFFVISIFFLVNAIGSVNNDRTKEKISFGKINYIEIMNGNL